MMRIRPRQLEGALRVLLAKKEVGAGIDFNALPRADRHCRATCPSAVSSGLAGMRNRKNAGDNDDPGMCAVLLCRQSLCWFLCRIFQLPLQKQPPLTLTIQTTRLMRVVMTMKRLTPRKCRSAVPLCCGSC